MNNILNKIDEIQDYIYGTEINQGAYKDVSKKFEELRKRVKLFAIPDVSGSFSDWYNRGFKDGLDHRSLKCRCGNN